MSSKAALKLDWCNHHAAKYAVTHWHYSKSLPPPPHVRVGVWEYGKFCGVVVFARGATGQLLQPYGLSNVEGCELVRVALGPHDSPVSRIVGIAIKMLKKQSPGLRLIVSFADPAQGHVGAIYQAGNWIYAGQSSPSSLYRDRSGKLWHERMISPGGWKKVFGRYRQVLKPSECERVLMPGKHRYLLPLDEETKIRIAGLSEPYPKRATSESGDTSVNHTEKGGSIPTVAL